MSEPYFNFKLLVARVAFVILAAAGIALFGMVFQEQSPRPERPRFRFSLGWLFFATTAFGILLGSLLAIHALLDYATYGRAGPVWRFIAISSLGFIPPTVWLLLTWYFRKSDPEQDPPP